MQIDLEAEYNNRARVPGHPAIIAGWARDSAAYRAEAGPRHARESYGPGARQTLDLFRPARPAPGTAAVLFIHGGYWQGLDPSFFSHAARGLNARGVEVAVMGYDLCPEVSLGQIIEQAIAAARALYARTRRPIVACGHSAGGHLVACLAATDWPGIDPSYPEHLVQAGFGISGLYELEPLVPTSINDKLGLDIASARSFSPRLWDPPAGLLFDAWVGGRESPEYLRQSSGIAAVWAAAGNATRYVPVDGADHFTIVGALADKDSPMTRRLAEMAGLG
jgi:arylformamidase